ncbi:MAG: response regulator [Pseudomonadota bacterium]
MSVGHNDDTQDLVEFRKKDSREGRFQRYARARVRQFWLRQIMTAYGSATMGLLVDFRLGLILCVLAILGELIDISVLRFLLRQGHRAFRKKWAGWIATAAAGAQSIVFSICISLAWVAGGTATQIFCISFFAAAVLNGGIVANFQPAASWTRLSVYGISIVALLLMDGIQLGFDRLHWQVLTLSTLMFGSTLVLFLFFLLRIQDRHMVAEGALLSEKARVEKALQAKTAFLSSVSHQLRTPLNGIMGAGDMLAHSNPRPDQSALLSPLRSSAADLHALISDILDVTQLEKGGLLINRTVIDIDAILRGTVEKYRKRAEEKHLALTFSVEDELPEHVLGDADRISQIVSKLLSNAIRFTERGGIEVKVSVHHSALFSFAFINVTDTGIGIHPEKLREILSGDITETGTLDGGIGLGLRISQKLARQMGGNLLIESTPGSGTACRLTLELHKTNAEDKDLPDWNIANAAILVVEDNRTNQLIVKKMLGPTGASLFFANDGEEAVDQFHKYRPDLILMDLAMPKKTGLEATKDIRTFESESCAKPTPIIALTANAFDEDKRSCERVGMNGFLSKPVTKDALLSELQRAGQASLG